MMLNHVSLSFGMLIPLKTVTMRISATTTQKEKKTVTSDKAYND